MFFCKDRGIQLINTPPYHPASNWVSEKTVQTIKLALNREWIKSGGKGDTRIVQIWLTEILHSLMNMVSTASGKTPLSTIISYPPPRTWYNLMKYSKAPKVVIHHTSEIKNGQIVWVLNHKSKVPKFLEGILIKQIDINTFLVKVDGIVRVYHKH